MLKINNNFTPKETLTWGTRFLMTSFGIMADLIGALLFFTGLLGILIGPLSTGAGTAIGAGGGCLAGGAAGAAGGALFGGIGALPGAALGCAAGAIAGAAAGSSAGAAAGTVFGAAFEFGIFILNWIVTAFVGLSYWLWFKIKVGHGVRRKSSSKQLLYMTVSVAVESVLGFLPGWTIFALLSIRNVKREDAKYNREMIQKINTNYRTAHGSNDNEMPRYRRGFQRQIA